MVKQFPMLAPGPQSQPAQLWGNTELLPTLNLGHEMEGRRGEDMEKMTPQKHEISYTKIPKKKVSLIKKWDGFPSVLAIAFSLQSCSVLEELRVWVKIHGTEILPEVSVLHIHP